MGLYIMLQHLFQYLEVEVQYTNTRVILKSFPLL